MNGWVECIPNFSEGQDEAAILELESVVRATPGVVFLRKDPNPDHNRTVFTFAGPGESVKRAAFELIRQGIQRIDLNRHVGVHPRMGAIDVVPFVPLGTTTMQDAVELSRKLGEQVGRELQVPVFLYEESATDIRRRSLAAIRRGGFEGHLRSAYPVGDPDFGPSRPHPTAGSIAIGARSFLIAINIVLDTHELPVAKTIARMTRESSGGLPAVRALGLPLTSQGLVQVSINLLDFRQTSVTRVFQRVQEEARRLGVAILESELVGLMPRAALVGAVWDLLKLPAQRRERIIEDAIEHSGAFTFAGRLAAAVPVPGGGAAAARAGHHGASLVVKVARISLRRVRSLEARALLAAEEQQASRLSRQFRELEDDDQRAFSNLLEAMRLPRAGEPEAQVRREAVEKAALRAIEVPLRTIETAVAMMKTIHALVKLSGEGHVRAESDLGVAAELAAAASRGAEWNVRVNLPQLAADKARAGIQERWKELRGHFEDLYRSIQEPLIRRLG